MFVEVLARWVGFTINGMFVDNENNYSFKENLELNTGELIHTL